MSSSKERISNRTWRRCAAGLAVLCALAFAAPPAAADSANRDRGHWRGNSERDRGWKNDRGRGHREWRRAAPRVYHREYQERHWYTPWRRPQRIIYFDDRPFYFNGTFGLFFDDAAFSVRMSEAPPFGCAYYDPYCDMPIGSVTMYQSHVRHHHHPALVQVVWVGR